MSAEARPSLRLGPPITLQLISLSLAGWAITLAVTAAIVLFLPPPASPLYRLSELNDALRGGSLVTRDGRPLMRYRQADPPLVGERWVSSLIYRRALARELNVPQTSVRFERYQSADPVRRALLRALLWSPPRMAATTGALPPTLNAPFYPPGVRPLLAVDGPTPLPPAMAFREAPPVDVNPPPIDRLPPVAGDFSVAVQQAAGDWMVVKPSPEPFPNPWQQRFILWFVACFIIIGPAGYFVARRLTAPIGLFAQAAERLGRDPTAPAIELSGPAEIGRAASAFNEMQARLKRYVEHRTEMIGAVAHDLRTPLARVRFKIETLPPGVKDSIGRDILQMEQMIDAALAFVRDAAHIRSRELFDLGSVVQCVVDSAAMMGADVKLASSEPVIIEADGFGLGRLFSNLIDNAVKYGRRARVRIYRQDGSAVVEISDSGPGLQPAELERVFEPFYRVEPSRNPDTGGIGLGLAVGRSIARAHGGDVSLANGARGLVARVRLPLPSESSISATLAAAAALTASSGSQDG